MTTADGGGDAYDQYDGDQIPDFSSDSYYKSGSCKARRVLTFFLFFSCLITLGDFQFYFQQQKWKAGLGAETAPLDLQMEDPVAFDAIPQQQVFICVCLSVREREEEGEGERDAHTHMQSFGVVGGVWSSGIKWQCSRALSLTHSQNAHMYVYKCVLIITHAHTHTHTHTHT